MQCKELLCNAEKVCAMQGIFMKSKEFLCKARNVRYKEFLCNGRNVSVSEMLVQCKKFLTNAKNICAMQGIFAQCRKCFCNVRNFRAMQGIFCAMQGISVQCKKFLCKKFLSNVKLFLCNARKCWCKARAFCAMQGLVVQCNKSFDAFFLSFLFSLKTGDRFPELSKNDVTSLVDQKNSENTKKATKRLTASTI